MINLEVKNDLVDTISNINDIHLLNELYSLIENKIGSIQDVYTLS
jgi:hypothetical protein